MALTEIGARLRLAGAPAFAKDARKGADGLDRLGNKAKGASRDVSGLERAAKRSRSALGSIAKGAAFGGIGAAAAGIGALSVGLIQGFKDAASLQTMLAKTNAVVESTGGAAKVSAASVVKMSDKLEAMSMIDQEAILQGQNLLLTFTKVRNGVGESNHVFDQATVAMVNMASAMGKDPQSAAIMLGKALNDPVKGMTAMGKAGVSFSDAQKKQVKSLVAAGKTMDAQKVILKELEVQFGGAAKAAGSGFEGALFRAKDALGDLFRDVATPLLPGFTRKIEDLSVYLSDTATPAIIDFVKGFQDETGAGGQLRADLIGIRDGAKEAWPHVKNVADKTMQFVRFLSEHPNAVQNFVVGVVAYKTAMKGAAFYTGLMATRAPLAATGIGKVGTASTTAVGSKAAGTGLLGFARGLSAISLPALSALMAYIALKNETSTADDANIIAGAPTATIGNKPRPGTIEFDGKLYPQHPQGGMNGDDRRQPVATVTPKPRPKGNLVGAGAPPAQGGYNGPASLTVPVYLNGRQVGEAVIDDLENRAARR